MDILRSSFTKLNGDNYNLWKYKLELILKREKLWSCVSVAPAASSTSDWVKQNDEATAIIGLSMEDPHLFFIKKAKSAYEAWNILRCHHEKDTLGSSVRLMRKICGLRFSMERDISEHIMEMKILFEKLEALGEQFTERWLVGMLLSSLPSSFDTLITALEACKLDELTLKAVETSLIEEYQRQTKDAKPNTAMKSTSRDWHKQKVCHHCKLKGHIMKNCWKLKKSKAGDNQKTMVSESNEKHMCFGMTNGNNNWILDSGATCHISTQISDFVSIDKSVKETVTVASGETVTSVGKGMCKIVVLNSRNENQIVDVKDVLYIPSFHGNLLSVTKIIKNGFRVVFHETLCCIQDRSGKEVGVADNKNGLFVLRTYNGERAMVTECKGRKCQHYWHRIFGHRNIDDVRKMQNGKTVGDFKIIDCGIRKKCEVCIKSKMVKSLFESSNSASKNAIDLVHTDVCGPMQTPTASGFRYFLTFIDNFSRYTIVYLLHNKSEVFEKTKIYLEMMKNKFQRYPQIIRSDNGGEYTSNKLKQYLENLGVIQQFTVPYNPQQNGVAERKNRSLVEMVRCLLNDAKLPNYLWGEAILTANYIQNRLVTSTSHTIRIMGK